MPRIALFLLSSLVVAAAPVQAQEWREELLEEAVELRDGKMVIEEYGLVKIAFAGYEASQFQVKLYSEAPATAVISRDNFVAMTAMMQLTILLNAFAEAYQVSATDFIKAWDLTELEAPIGTPDLEVNLYMTAEGMQIEVVNTASGERTRHTTTWAEVYGQG